MRRFLTEDEFKELPIRSQVWIASRGEVRPRIYTVWHKGLVDNLTRQWSTGFCIFGEDLWATRAVLADEGDPGYDHKPIRPATLDELYKKELERERERKKIQAERSRKSRLLQAERRRNMRHDTSAVHQTVGAVHRYGGIPGVGLRKSVEVRRSNRPQGRPVERERGNQDRVVQSNGYAYRNEWKDTGSTRHVVVYVLYVSSRGAKKLHIKRDDEFSMCYTELRGNELEYLNPSAELLRTMCGQCDIRWEKLCLSL